MSREEATIIEAFRAAGRPLAPDAFRSVFQDRDDVERMNADNRARIRRLQAQADVLREML